MKADVGVALHGLYVMWNVPKASNANSFSQEFGQNFLQTATNFSKWRVRCKREKKQTSDGTSGEKQKFILPLIIFARFMYRVHRMASVYAYMLLYLLACNSAFKSSWLMDCSIASKLRTPAILVYQTRRRGYNGVDKTISFIENISKLLKQIWTYILYDHDLVTVNLNVCPRRARSATSLRMRRMAK